jgi:hypothetical protein
VHNFALYIAEDAPFPHFNKQLMSNKLDLNTPLAIQNFGQATQVCHSEEVQVGYNNSEEARLCDNSKPQSDSFTCNN